MQRPYGHKDRGASTQRRAQTVNLAVGSGELISKAPGKTITPRITLTPLDASGSPAPERTTLAPNESLTLRIGLKGVVDEGDWTLELQNAGLTIGALTVVSPPALLNVKLDVATPDSPALSFEKDRPSRIPLKNEDSAAYVVRGEYSVKGSVVNSGEITLPAKGGAEIAVVPPDDWFSPSLSGLFKDEEADGRLTVRSRSSACKVDDGTPVRIFKVKTTLSSLVNSVQGIMGEWPPSWHVALRRPLLGGAQLRRSHPGPAPPDANGSGSCRAQDRRPAGQHRFAPSHFCRDRAAAVGRAATQFERGTTPSSPPKCRKSTGV